MMETVKGIKYWAAERLQGSYWKNKGMEISKNLSILAKQAKELGAKGVLFALLKDIFLGWKPLEVLYLVVLVGIQLGVYIKQPDSFLGMIAGATGIINVIFVTKGKISNYFFGTINVVIYLYLSIISGFYGEVLTSIYFFLMQFTGTYLWLLNLDKQEDGNAETAYVKPKRLSVAGWIKAIIGMTFIWGLFGFIYRSIGANRPFRDSVTDGTNYVGQWLMNGSYSAQWLFWIGTNVFSIYLWWGASLEMVVMYWVFLVNSIVGYIRWTNKSRTDCSALEQ
ncbi:nicotinamide mononucleotide transporter [Enterococcus sp. BWM-S5]|uniref:Nicotinamide mononucleotide transporter n=1 Tax=Enterococcus larvae TaxID=2794352 RepID=A0ABS4CLP2_9ENTE|nr:nicotinamide riboside transporter PnuC [Enterococcus larvae]MBP1047520.1 nicotinamide mononucleotide transporter [Enterococcus larvae]